MDSKAIFEKEELLIATVESVKLYQAIVGSVIYAMVEIRPDIVMAVSVLSRYCTNPNENHFNVIKRLLRYLKGTLSYGITYGQNGKEEDLVVYTDADWGGDKETRRSIGGYLTVLYGGAVSWSLKRQATVALSSCEAEYMG